jgi:ectoine hydroxylase-related dioxygenase (phytanoyl-CoA dioxygenase family)
LTFAPTLSIARAVFGPYVQLRGFTGRVCYPDDPNQETEWHFHQRLIPDPIPPWFARPHTMDVLLYLDDITDATGPLCVVPGSHNRIAEDQPANLFDDLPGQVVLRLPAGSAVFAHGALWHRALPTQPGGTIRRLLLLGYGPTWMQPSIYGVRPANGLTEALRTGPDRETRELLGAAGYM